VRCHLDATTQHVARQSVAAIQINRFLCKTKLRPQRVRTALIFSWFLYWLDRPIINTTGHKRHWRNSSHHMTDTANVVAEGAEQMRSEHEYAVTPNIVTLSRYCENAVFYIAPIAGSVACNVNKPSLVTNAQALTSDNGDLEPNSVLFRIADRGGLTRLSSDTVPICKKLRNAASELRSANHQRERAS